MARRQTYVGEPRLLHQVTEPRGDGHPVLLPGFMADEGTLIVLKLFLQNRGYEV